MISECVESKRCVLFVFFFLFSYHLLRTVKRKVVPCFSLSISLTCVNTSGLNVCSLSQGLFASHVCFVDSKHFSLTHSAIKCSTTTDCSGEVVVWITYTLRVLTAGILFSIIAVLLSLAVWNLIETFFPLRWLLSTHTAFFLLFIFMAFILLNLKRRDWALSLWRGNPVMTCRGQWSRI